MKVLNLPTILILVLSVFSVRGQFDPNFAPNHNVIVHLFEWKWADIAEECEKFLGPNGFGGVQVSPPTENVVVAGRPWWERYQPISYKIQTRSGDEKAFKDMCQRCKKAGVNIYADAVINHMSVSKGKGVADSEGIAETRQYPSVPYGPGDFNPPCIINNYLDEHEVRDCSLNGLPDLNHGKDYVRDKVVELLNKLVDLGVSGFRVDAAKHMWFGNLEAIYSRIKNLPDGKRPYIYQEVIDLGGEGIKATEYTHLGAVTEFKFSAEIGKAFRGGNQLKYLRNFGEGWGFMKSDRAVTFIDNHDNQRGHGAGGPDILTFKDSRQYKMATAFHLAWNYGTKIIMSSFDFNNSDQGPPADSNENIISPKFNAEGACINGWICEHRWRQIYNMVKFLNSVAGTGINDWWDNDYKQIAFGRGDKGFIVFNGQFEDLNQYLQTGMAPGKYCDIVSGNKKGDSCSGRVITIDDGRKGQFSIAGNAEDGFIAITEWSKL